MLSPISPSSLKGKVRLNFEGSTHLSKLEKPPLKFRSIVTQTVNEGNSKEFSVFETKKSYFMTDFVEQNVREIVFSVAMQLIYFDSKTATVPRLLLY